MVYRFPLRVVARNSLRMSRRSCLEKDWSGRWHPCVFKGWRIGSYEPFRGRHQVGDLYAEPLSALGSPTAHDLSSTSRLHTSPKSVCSFSSNGTGLIGAFHSVFLLLSITREWAFTRILGFLFFFNETLLRSEICSRRERRLREAGSIPLKVTCSLDPLSNIGEHKSPVLSTWSAPSPPGSYPLPARRPSVLSRTFVCLG